MFEGDPTAETEVPPPDPCGDLSGTEAGDTVHSRARAASATIDVDGLVERAIGAKRDENAARLRLVRSIAEVAVAEAWRPDGQTSMANWVAWKLGCSRRTARDLIAVAQVIDERPALAAAFADGRLSWDQ